MINAKSSVSPTEQVVFTEMQSGESVLLNLGTSRFYSLNQTATYVWRLLDDGLRVSEIGRRLEDTYDVSADMALQSVLELVVRLAEERLVQSDDELSDALPRGNGS